MGTFKYGISLYVDQQQKQVLNVKYNLPQTMSLF